MNRTIAILGTLALSACAGMPDHPPLYEGLGSLHRAVATDSEAAQRYFDQGLILTYAFNHDEAVRSFREAQRHDPACAMAHWGEAYALGPNINLPMDDPEVAKQAYDAAQRALALASTESGANRALIDCLVTRYEEPAPAERKHLDQAYADSMREAFASFPNDPDVAALFAESLLDVNPWETWTKDGAPMANIEEAVAALEAAMKTRLDHPLANHLYIHALEASPNPAKAEAAADRLGTFAPAAGHLVHMPAHIYINVGRYRDAEEANRKAVIADRAYFDGVGPQGIYEFYRAHNHHFLVYAAMFAGRKESALRSARELISDLPDHAFTEMAPFVDGFLAVPLHAMIRFGDWEGVLNEPQPGERFPVARALWRYARGIAFAATGRVAEAKVEQAAFETAAALVTDEMVIGINPAPPVMIVARHMLAGEILYRAAEFDAAFDELRRAVQAEDALRYDEPSPWMQPVRHALGALLLEQGRVAEADEVYRADLLKHPENAWSLHGLAQCAKRRGAKAEEAKLLDRFELAWADADIEMAASCFCHTSAGASPPRKSCCDDAIAVR